ncbi:MAG: carbohydrate kinase family protein [Candidatus Zambryskibacteria bacterium]|nr:carbohydrate kinase family protein [Candidatus Zambryskibacteria bacterium]
MNNKQIDILAVGDITIDAFIKLKDAQVTCDIDHENCKLCFGFGDKIPYESVTVCNAVGNSANAAVSSSRLGLSSAILTHIGNDQNGKDCLVELEKNNVDTQYVRVENNKHTNHNYILWYDVDRTILTKHETFTYNLDGVIPPKWIYFSSLGENSLQFHMEIADFIEKNPETKLAFQPGTFQIKAGAKTLERIYKNAEIFFCNVEETQKILDEKSRDLPILLEKMASLGPKIVVITDGFEGAYVFDTKSGSKLFMPVYPHTPFERTGAGDAFASTIVSSLALGKSLEEALLWAPINSMSVTQHIGSQEGLLTLEKIQEFLSKAPENFKPKKI